MKFVGIIPARYASSRFPGKPLVEIKGKPMIQHVYEKGNQALENIYVATDDQRIFDTVTEFGGNAVMTDKKHQSGTDRCAEAAKFLSATIDFDAVINIQGDEPFINPLQIELLKSHFNSVTQVATLIKKIDTTDILLNPNRPKVVMDKFGYAVYFSRSPIPYSRGVKEEEWIVKSDYWAHIGMYAYRSDVLQEISKLKPTKLEQAESLEQLRWLENGYKIKTVTTSFETIGIDTPKDLEKALQLLQ